MKILILEKCVTSSNTLKKGDTVDVRGIDAEALVQSKKAQYTKESLEIIKKSKKILEDRAKARKENKGK